MEPICKSREEVFKVADSASHRGIPCLSEVIIVRLFFAGAGDADRDAEADAAGARREHQEAARDAAEQGRR